MAVTGMPVVTVAAGGLPVVDATTGGRGAPVSEATNGRGVAVTKVANGRGMPVVYAGGGGAGPNLGPELVPDPGFGTPAQWSVANGAVVSGGIATLGPTTSSRVTAATLTTPILATTTYAWSLNVLSFNGVGNLNIQIGGATPAFTFTGVGVASGQFTTTAAISQLVRVQANSGMVATVDDISVKQVLP